jgi:polyhydroxybutyrate depolymerase
MKLQDTRNAPSCAWLAALVFASGCLDGLEPPPVRPATELRVLKIGDHDRQFYLSKGSATTTTAPRPLLIVYHGAGDAAYNLYSNTGLAAAGVNAGMVVAFPDAVEGYNARWATNPVDLQIVDDLDFSRKMVDRITEEAAIDRTRIFAVGYSRGGDLVYQIACRAPEFLRAAAPMASTTLNSNLDWCEETKSNALQPALAVILGSVDPLMPWDGGLEHRMGALATASLFAARNGCRTGAPSEQPVPAYSGYVVKRFVHDPCVKGDVHLYRIESLGHSWPANAFDMDKLLMQWFLAQPPR